MEGAGAWRSGDLANGFRAAQLGTGVNQSRHQVPCCHWPGDLFSLGVINLFVPPPSLSILPTAHHPHWCQASKTEVWPQSPRRVHIRRSWFGPWSPSWLPSLVAHILTRPVSTRALSHTHTHAHRHPDQLVTDDVKFPAFVTAHRSNIINIISAFGVPAFDSFDIRYQKKECTGARIKQTFGDSWSHRIARITRIGTRSTITSPPQTLLSGSNSSQPCLPRHGPTTRRDFKTSNFPFRTFSMQLLEYVRTLFAFSPLLASTSLRHPGKITTIYNIPTLDWSSRHTCPPSSH